MAPTLQKTSIGTRGSDCLSLLIQVLHLRCCFIKLILLFCSQGSLLMRFFWWSWRRGRSESTCSHQQNPGQQRNLDIEWKPIHNYWGELMSWQCYAAHLKHQFFEPRKRSQSNIHLHSSAGSRPRPSKLIFVHDWRDSEAVWAAGCCYPFWSEALHNLQDFGSCIGRIHLWTTGPRLQCCARPADLCEPFHHKLCRL